MNKGDQLRQSDERSRLLYESSRDAIMILEPPAWKFIAGNKAARELFGAKDEAQFISFGPPSLSPERQPDGRLSGDKAKEMIDKAVKEGSHFFEWRHKRISGEEFEASVLLTKVEMGAAMFVQATVRDITAQKRLERELKARSEQLDTALKDAVRTKQILTSMLDDNNQIRVKFEAAASKFQLILSSAGEGIFGLDKEGNHTFVNPQALKMLGYTEVDLIGKESHVLWHYAHSDGSVYPAQECPNFKTIHDGQPRHGEEYYWRKDGTGFPVEFNSVALVENGEIAGAVISFRDITERKQFEKALRLSEESTRSITDSAQDAIIMMDTNGNISFWNPSAEKILGYKYIEAIGKNLHQFIVPAEFHAAHLKAFPEFLRTGTGAAVGKTLELVAIRKDGVHIPVDLSLSAIKREDGYHAVGIMRDISERKKSEERLLSLTRAIEQSPVTIVITDLTGAIEYANPKALQLTGYSLDELRGQNPRVLKSGEMKAEEYKKLWADITSGKEWHGEFHNKKKNGELYWETASISPIRNAKGEVTHFLAVKEDISEQKRRNEEIKQMRAQLDASQAQLFQTAKLSTMGEMATGLAHEINQPLGVISLVAATFRKFQAKKLMTDDKLDAGLKDVEACVKRMTNTINHIRAFSRQETLKSQSMRVTDTIDSALILMGEQMRMREIELVKEYTQDEPQIEGEPHQLEQVWINLISNARDSMDEKQKQILEGKFDLVGYRKKFVITVSADKEKGGINIAFTDNGMGLDKDKKDKVFDPFFTTKEVGKGTGLGLSISHGIIESHKGTIVIDGEKGEGATVKVHLPFKIEQTVENKPLFK